MKTGSKYAPLYEYLSQTRPDEITISFAEIERLLNSRLPASARRRQDWWSNRKSALQASAWMSAGYHVVQVDPAGERVTFRKAAKRYIVRQASGVVAWDGELVKGLRTHMGLNQSQLADELGVRQQTVSEWETGVYAPSRAMCKYLSLIAEQADFPYKTA